MAEKERDGKLSAKSLSVGGVKVPKVAAGTASITGTGTVTAPAGFTSITSVVATLGQDASLFGEFVTATWVGLTVTLKCWKPTSSTDGTPIASAAAKTVNYVLIGN